MEQKSIREAYASMHEPESMRQLGVFYWMIVVCLGVLLMLGSVGYGMWQFFVPPSSAKSGATVGGATAGFDKGLLQQAVQKLQKRQSDFESLLGR